ncbi:TonB-dependent receptor domain-containing protein [Acidobacteriota bacterium]
MRKKGTLVFLMIFLLAVISSKTAAQNLGGTIKAKITDQEGLPLPGAFVYADSPKLLDIKTYITSDTGKIKFQGLPTGRYKIIVEMPGFKTTNIDDIVVRTGKTIYLQIALELTNIEEEITILVPPSKIDSTSSKLAVVTETDIIEKIPFDRNLHNIINSAPGIIPDSIPYPQASVIHGSPVTSNIYAFDGINLSDPVDMHLLANLNFDVIEEVEIQTAATQAEIGSPAGGVINVITKSGGNKLSGGLNLYHTNEKLAGSLRPDEEIIASGASPPPIDKKLWDFSFSLGGAILEDKLWLFSNARSISRTRKAPFISWTDPQGKNHEEYDWTKHEKMLLFKLTSQFAPNLKISGMFHYTNLDRPIDEFLLSWNLPAEATYVPKLEKNFNLIGIVNYALTKNTSLDIKAGYIENDFPLLLDENLNTNPRYIDESTGYTWGSARLNETRLRKRFQAGANLTSFQDSLLGTDHEFMIGAEYEYTQGEWASWKENNLLVHYDNGNPYFFGLAESPPSGNTVGKGNISFFTAGTEQGALNSKNEARKLGFFIQDSITFAERITLSLGIRLELFSGNQLGFTKEASGNPVSLKIWEELIEPLAGLNPYAEVSVPEWKDQITWTTWSPRFGIAIDLFGDGRSLLKASFSRYKEYMMLQYTSPLHPFSTDRSHSFFWYDENMDGQVDEQDTYVLFPEDYRFYDEEFYKKKINPEIKSPHTNEYSIGLQQKLLHNFSVRVSYIYKDKNRILENVLYDPVQDKEWYTTDNDTEGWWIPFNTIIPQSDDFQATPVSLYFRSKNAPLLFDRLTNVPELKRKYHAFELTFKKQMSNKWQLNGSLVLSRASGNIGLNRTSNTGFSSAANTPNYFINFPEDSRLDFDRPLVLKLMGTYNLPYGFYLSFFYTHMRGTPWVRSVTVIPPSSWAEKENAYTSYVNVLLEKPGLRRNVSFNNLDIRIEKEFRLKGSARISTYFDIYNVLGNKYQSSVQNDGGYWFPADENSTAGTRILSPNYKKITSLFGARVIKFCLQLSF